MNMASSSSTLISFVILISCFPLKCYSDENTINNKKIKGMFVFGSSLVDTGNNNFLLVNKKASSSYFPYGIDFPLNTTGRFSNGKNVIDVLCDHLKIPLLPPFYDPSTKGEKIMHGVDFASGGSGIFNFSGTVLGGVKGMNPQIDNFKSTLSELEERLGQKSEEFLQNYIIVVGVGGNDYSSNFFVFKTHGNLENFTTNLVVELSTQLMQLYCLGGRKFVLMSANPLGCYPMYRSEKNCREEYNKAAELYNSQLKYLVDVFQQKMPGSHLVFVNSYRIIMDIINNPILRGFKNVKDQCYKAASMGTQWSVCENRNEYVFFDGVHPTQAVSLIVGEKAFSSKDQYDVYPINVHQLSMM